MINSVYNYYLTTYAGKELTKYDTHKKSELRGIYNNIVKISRKSPLYKVSNTEDVQRYAIDLKETARNLKNVTQAFHSATRHSFGLTKKKAVSSNEDILDVRYTGDGSDSDEQTSLSMTVQKLAAPQVNTGDYLSNSACKIAPGDYSFDCSVGGNTYEFQFNIHQGETNHEVQTKLADLFNRSAIGLEAEILTSPSGNTALEIRSLATGIQGTGKETFSIRPNESEGSDKLVKYLGIRNVSSFPEDAVFTVNGEQKHSSSNTFVLDKKFEVTLKNVSDEEDDPVSVHFKQDVDALIDNTGNLTDSYNNMLLLARKNAAGSYETAKLQKEILSLARRHRSDLESSGIKIDENGYLSVDTALMTQIAEEDGLSSTYEKLSDFKDAIASKADGISINPMHYVDKTLISYPNPIRTFTNPYVTSIYSGMMFNGYV